MQPYHNPYLNANQNNDTKNPEQPPPPPPPPAINPQQNQQKYVVPVQNTITINNMRRSRTEKCIACHSDAGFYTTRTIGNTAMAWACILWCFTGILCCWIPFVIDDCKDKQVICSKCHKINRIVPAKM